MDNNNLTYHITKTDRKKREEMLGQKAVTLWFTGLSGSGKSTVADALEQKLCEMGKHTMLLDGDNIRFGLNSDLGFSEADRVENIRRIAHVCKLLNDAGVIVLASFVSPYAADRQKAKEIIGETAFTEIYVSTPIEECERRDVKGLYKKARAGEIAHFTGISDPYEAPLSPDVAIDTSKLSLAECVERVLVSLK